MSFNTWVLKTLKLSQWKSHSRLLFKKAFNTLGVLQKSLESTVRTRARGTSRRETVRVDRGGTCNGNNSSNVWQSRPLLDTGLNCSSFRFPLVSLQSLCSKPFCTTAVWPMMLEDFDVIFSGTSFYDNRRFMASPWTYDYRAMQCYNWVDRQSSW